MRSQLSSTRDVDCIFFVVVDSHGDNTRGSLIRSNSSHQTEFQLLRGEQIVRKISSLVRGRSPHCQKSPRAQCFWNLHHLLGRSSQHCHLVLWAGCSLELRCGVAGQQPQLCQLQSSPSCSYDSSVSSSSCCRRCHNNKNSGRSTRDKRTGTWNDYGSNDYHHGTGTWNNNITAGSHVCQ